MVYACTNVPRTDVTVAKRVHYAGPLANNRASNATVVVLNEPATGTATDALPPHGATNDRRASAAVTKASSSVSAAGAKSKKRRMALAEAVVGEVGANGTTATSAAAEARKVAEVWDLTVAGKKIIKKKKVMLDS